MSYKNTLNIPKTNFPMRANLSINAEKFANYWIKSKIFKKLSQRENAKTFVLHDGPPYANGDIHIGHALNKILKDFIIRYKAFQGYQIHYVPGGDTHGLPIENKVEKITQNKTLDILEKRKLCREYALEQVEKQKSQFKSLHLLSDFESTYKTIDSSFIQFELNLLSYLLDQKLLYWGFKPVAWSWSLQTALAESEIIYKEVETTSIYLWFPIAKDYEINRKKIKKGTRMLIGTTTPYTLEANLASIVHPQFNYVIVRDNEGNEYLILEEAMSKLDLDCEVINTFQGIQLNGVNYLNTLTNEVNRIITDDYVTKSHGSGIVHAAPAYGLEDYEACQREKIEMYISIDKEGKFISNSKFAPINNLFFADASKVIIAWLKDNGYLYSEETIKHNVGHDWRTEKPLMYLASPQGFLNVEPLFSKIESEFKSFSKTYPKGLNEKLREMIVKRNLWCLSRQRYWGVPIPVLFDENGNPILNQEQIKHSIEILNREGADVGFLKDPSYFLCPALKEKYKGKNITKSQDILDVGFDSGCSWGILGGNVPADIYLEGFDQLRGGFNSSSITSIASCGKLPFKAIVGHGFVLDKDGNKMSKSKGNVISPLDLVKQYGTDVLRLGIGLNNYHEDIKISNESIEHAVSFYRKIRNTVFRYSLSLIGENFVVNGEIIDNLKIPENIYIYQTFRDTGKNIEENLENHQFFKALKSSIDFLNIYSGGYLEICKDTLYCGNVSSPEYKEIINIVGEVFEKLLFFFGIFAPQTAEETGNYYKPNEESIFLKSWPKLSSKSYEIKENGEKFGILRDELYVLVEALKQRKIVSGSTSVSAIIPQSKRPENLNLVKLLNIGEMLDGDHLDAKLCELVVCARCGRHNKILCEQLCQRCEGIIRN